MGRASANGQQRLNPELRNLIDWKELERIQLERDGPVEWII